MAHMCLSLSFRLLIVAHGSQTTLEVCLVSSRNLNHPLYLSKQDTLQKALQYYNSLYKYKNILHQSNGESLTTISLQTIYLVITNHKFQPSRQWGNKRVPLILHSKEVHHVQECTTTVYCWPSSGHKGLTNPKYKGTQ